MTASVQTQAQLLADFPLLGGTCAYGPQQFQNFIVSVPYLAGGYANVISYGADPTGATDSTSAFGNALASGLPVVVPFGTYEIGNLTVPSNSTIFGWAPLGYPTGSSATSGLYPLINLKSGSTVMFNVSSAVNVRVSGLYLFGGGTGTAFNGGSNQLNLEYVTMHEFSTAVGDTTNVTHVGTFINCQLTYCGTYGYVGLQDSSIIGGAITACGIGHYVYAGSNNMTGVRVEYCTNIGVYVYGNSTAGLQIEGGLFDANYNYGISIASSGLVSVSNVFFRRNGINLTSGANGHVNINGSVNCIFVGCMTQTGNNGGSNAPTNSIVYQGTNTQIQLIGCNWRGNTSGNYEGGTAPSTDYVLSGCLT